MKKNQMKAIELNVGPQIHCADAVGFVALPREKICGADMRHEGTLCCPSVIIIECR